MVDDGLRVLRRAVFRHPLSDVRLVFIKFIKLGGGVENPKYGAASHPDPAAHCQPPAFDARSKSRRWRAKNRSPHRQSVSKCLHKKEATTMRTRLCMNPVLHQFAHARINQWIARSALAPRGKMCFVVVPWDGVVRRSEAVRCGMWKMVNDALVEIPPNQFCGPFSLCWRPARKASRMLTVPKRKWSDRRDVPATAGKSRLSP